MITMETYNDKVAKEEVKSEYFSNGKKVFAHMVGDSGITITRDAVRSLISDMDRYYETAGFLLGYSKDGKITFDTYVQNHAVIIRDATFLEKDRVREKSEMLKYAKKGFNAVILVHLHPEYDEIEITPSSMEKTLNEFDKKVATESSGPVGKETGFVSIYSGVLSRTALTSTKIFRLSIFDALNGAEKAENFQVSHEEKLASNVKSSISRLLRKPAKAVQEVKYMYDKLPKGTEMFTINSIITPLGAEEIAEISRRVNSMVSNMDIHPSVKEGIYVYADARQKTYTVVIKEPVGVRAYLHKNELNNAKKSVFKAAEDMFNHS